MAETILNVFFAGQKNSANIVKYYNITNCNPLKKVIGYVVKL